MPMSNDRLKLPRNVLRCFLLLLLLISAVCLLGQQAKQPATASFPLDSVAGLELLNVKAEVVSYQGRRAVRLVATHTDPEVDDAMLAILPGTDFKDGTIEAEVAGSPRPDAPKDDRGFLGIAFRVHNHGGQFENIYIRATNGRAEDQIRRNHAVQYESVPDFPWFRLRKESPGVYESYTDLEAGAWTKMKVVVSGTKARLYINGADQPCLIVNDLKLGDSHGAVALWAYWSTDAYFSNVTIHNN